MLSYSFEEFSVNLNKIFGNPVLVAVMIGFLLFATYTDVKSLKIYNKFNLCFLITRIIFIFIPTYNLPLTSFQVAGAICGSLVLMIPAIHFMQKMGGDIKLIFVLGLFLGIDLVFLLIGLSCATLILYSAIKKIITKQDVKHVFVPFAVFFTISFLIMFTINIILI